MKEIDLVIEADGILHPLEIKKGSAPERKLVNAFSFLKGAERPTGNGGIICMTDTPLPIDEENCFIPAGIL